MLFMCVCRLLGWLSLYCLHSLYILSSLLFLCFSPLFFTFLFYSVRFYTRRYSIILSVCFIGVCVLLVRLLAVACGMYRYVFYRCVSVAWVVASWVGGCKENLDDIRAKPFQAIHKHILARKPHNCLLEIQDVPQSRNGSRHPLPCRWSGASR